MFNFCVINFFLRVGFLVAYFCGFPDGFFFCSVERDRLREQERQVRAQMSAQAAEREQNQQALPELFARPIRVSSQI